MARVILFLFFGILLFSCSEKSSSTVKTMEVEKPEYAIVIHGGAGTILKKNMTQENEKAHREAMHTALDIGEAVLKEGGSSLDAVEQSIKFMEDSPLFNAGKGAVFTHAGTNEMDASFMYGKDQNAGAVGGISTIRHPISAARAVLEKSEHVMMAGKGAEDFAKSQGLEVVDPSYFYTERRWKSLQRILNSESDKTELSESDDVDKKHGTVGCVALDKDGNIAAGTSTGGMTNKKFNRIGDSPIIGAGTFADNATCGVSSTGHGEYFIRYTVARDIAALMEYGGKSLKEAGEIIINKKLVEKGGTGGVVALDRNGNIAMPFNTPGMYRGYAKPGERVVKIYKED
ncbi:MAG: isoaspartyl peptidase/L-asparaginase [Saprospiraceae bacterium]|nr:isoaspartyl peptidase/L-asparaginase [Saprospiraceae bacterium]